MLGLLSCAAAPALHRVALHVPVLLSGQTCEIQHREPKSCHQICSSGKQKQLLWTDPALVLWAECPAGAGAMRCFPAVCCLGCFFSQKKCSWHALAASSCMLYFALWSNEESPKTPPCQNCIITLSVASRPSDVNLIVCQSNIILTILLLCDVLRSLMIVQENYFHWIVLTKIHFIVPYSSLYIFFKWKASISNTVCIVESTHSDLICLCVFVWGGCCKQLFAYLFFSKNQMKPWWVLECCYISVYPCGPRRNKVLMKAGLEHSAFGCCGSQGWAVLEPDLLCSALCQQPLLTYITECFLWF